MAKEERYAGESISLWNLRVYVYATEVLATN